MDRKDERDAYRDVLLNWELTPQERHELLREYHEKFVKRR